MNRWLSQRADALAEATGLDRATLELDPPAVEILLELAGYAAHESGARTNAPLVCFLLGRAQASGKSLDELSEILRSTS